MSIFSLEYAVLFIILLAAACKMLKVFFARGISGKRTLRESRTG
jgi:hypothetical protein